MMTKLALQFWTDEDGAVTVDWVVLTAAIVGLGIAVITAVATSIDDVTEAIDADINQAGGFDQTVAAALND
jgi:Flp pilus assembly pilin Flp